MDSDNLVVFVLTTRELIVNCTLVHTITGTNTVSVNLFKYFEYQAQL